MLIIPEELRGPVSLSARELYPGKEENYRHLFNHIFFTAPHGISLRVLRAAYHCWTSSFLLDIYPAREQPISPV